MKAQGNEQYFSSCQHTFMSSLIKQKPELHIETIWTSCTNTATAWSVKTFLPAAGGAGSETLGGLCAVAVTGKSHEGRVSCSCTWIPCAAPGDEVIWAAKQTSPAPLLLQGCSIKLECKHICLQRTQKGMFLLGLSLEKKAPDNQWILMKLTQQRRSFCKWVAAGLPGDVVWFMTILRVIHPPSGRHRNETLGQPHNKYRCWHTDSTSHRSRQFMLWVDWIWPPCPHLTPSN